MGRITKGPFVKICGLQRLEDVRMCMRHGADVLGFVVDYPKPVPWNLTLNEAKELMAAVNLPTKTCVVTGGTTKHVYEMAEMLRPHYIQLHWDIPLADPADLVESLKQINVKLIQTIFPNTPDLEQVAADFCHAGVYALLLDPRTPNGVEGGNADIIIWDKVQNAVTCPVILAGGITPKNVTKLIKGSNIWMIDLMTGVEITPGMKDEGLVVELFKCFS